MSRKNVTNLILNYSNYFNKLDPMSMIFAHSISRIFCYKSQLYFVTEPIGVTSYGALGHVPPGARACRKNLAVSTCIIYYLLPDSNNGQSHISHKITVI